MRERGYAEGENLVIEWRFADNRVERLPGLVRELIQSKVDVIVTVGSTPAALAAQKATTTIPIVLATAIDPVSVGLVRSLSRPGGNITGIANLSGDVGPKHLELLISLEAKIFRVALLFHPDNFAHPAILKLIQAAGEGAGIDIITVEARTAEEIEAAFTHVAARNADALIVVSDTLFYDQRRQIGALALKHRLASVGPLRQYAETGSLLSYGYDRADAMRIAATYVDKILKGAKPAELPVQQPTSFELVVNQKTAKALGIKIPPAILFRADRVIE